MAEYIYIALQGKTADVHIHSARASYRHVNILQNRVYLHRLKWRKQIFSASVMRTSVEILKRASKTMEALRLRTETGTRARATT